VLRDPKGLALILCLLVASFSYFYAYAVQYGQGGVLGAFTPIEHDESLKACGFIGSKPAFVLSRPSMTRVVIGELSMEVQMALMDACTSGDLAVVAGSQEGRPAIRLLQQPTIDETPLRVGGKVVASRKGSKYHFPWCSGGKTIREENIIWFDSIKQAQNAGYTPAGNCKGLK